MVYLMDKRLVRIRAVPRRTHFCTCCMLYGFGDFADTLFNPSLDRNYMSNTTGIVMVFDCRHYNYYYYLLLIIKLLTFEYTFL